MIRVGQIWRVSYRYSGTLGATAAPTLYVNGSPSGATVTLVTSTAGIIDAYVSLAGLSVEDRVQLVGGFAVVDGFTHPLTSAESRITSAELTASAVRTELATELSRIDVTMSSRLADDDYVVPNNIGIAQLLSGVNVSQWGGGTLPAFLLASSYTAPPTTADITTAVWAAATRTITGGNVNVSTWGGAVLPSFMLASSYTAPPSAADISTAVWAAATRTITGGNVNVSTWGGAALPSFLLASSYTAPPTTGDITTAVWAAATRTITGGNVNVSTWGGAALPSFLLASSYTAPPTTSAIATAVWGAATRTTTGGNVNVTSIAGVSVQTTLPAQGQTTIVIPLGQLARVTDLPKTMIVDEGEGVFSRYLDDQRLPASLAHVPGSPSGLARTQDVEASAGSGPGPGNGIYEVTIHVVDAANQPIPQATVRLSRAGEVVQNTTDVDGDAVVFVAGGSYTMLVHKAGVSFTPVTVTVDADETIEAEVSVYTPPPPPSAEQCTVIFDTYTPGLGLEASGKVWVRLVDPSPGVDASRTGVFDRSARLHLAVNGVVTLTLGRRCQYEIKRDRGEWMTFTTTDAATQRPSLEVLGALGEAMT